jgi:hypothetical protein
MQVRPTWAGSKKNKKRRGRLQKKWHTNARPEIATKRRVTRKEPATFEHSATPRTEDPQNHQESRSNTSSHIPRKGVKTDGAWTFEGQDGRRANLREFSSPRAGTEVNHQKPKVSTQFSNGEPITPKPDRRSLSGEWNFTGWGGSWLNWVWPACRIRQFSKWKFGIFTTGSPSDPTQRTSYSGTLKRTPS